jgi:hypothetical protein
MRLKPADAPKAYARSRARQEKLPHARNPGQAGVPAASTARAGRRLGSRAGRPLPRGGGRPKIQFGLPEVTLGLMPGASGVTKMTRHAGPDGRAALPGRRQNCSARAEALELGLVHELVADAASCAPRRWPGSSRQPQGAAALGRQGLQNARRHTRQPEDRRGAQRRAGHAQAEDARPLSGARGRAGLHGRRRAGGLRHRLAHRKPLPRQAHVSAQCQEHDQHLLLQHERHQERAVAPKPGCPSSSPTRSASWAPA